MGLLGGLKHMGTLAAGAYQHASAAQSGKLGFGPAPQATNHELSKTIAQVGGTSMGSKVAAARPLTRNVRGRR